MIHFIAPIACLIGFLGCFAMIYDNFVLMALLYIAFIVDHVYLICKYDK